MAGGDSGQGLAEYALALTIFALLAVATLVLLSGQVANILSLLGPNM